VEPTPEEIRVLGALLEKQRTTPDQYPLTLNALRLACNQSTNRDPVVDYDEQTIKDALSRLRQRGWTRYASGQGSRAAKYRHLLDQELDLGRDELAVLCVMMLRGPQTPGELKQRTERMHPFSEDTLERLIERGLVERQRRPGQKEDRFRHLRGSPTEGSDAPTAGPVSAPSPRPDLERSGGESSAGHPRVEPPDAPVQGLDLLASRVSSLEAGLAEVREELAALRRDLGD
jgi:uncharacterized protein YceH (UPF0502 family)